ncbi:MAG: hypothetical protein V7K57_22950, partial [Nostoc sp.]|uniref:hypothetical protein n=1 Tax=Nostoc sp. TaxID=1180 RepID=UPI002FFB9AD3
NRVNSFRLSPLVSSLIDIYWLLVCDHPVIDYKYSCKRLIEELELHDFNPEQFLLTISVSEPFIPLGQEKEFCYKLIVAVTNVEDVKKRFGKT